MFTVISMWLDGKQSSGKIPWLLSSAKLDCKKNKSITKFVLLLLSEYWVGTYWMGKKRLRSKESAISSKVPLWDEWKGKDRSQTDWLPSE